MPDENMFAIAGQGRRGARDRARREKYAHRKRIDIAGRAAVSFLILKRLFRAMQKA
jgi:hypothetical protein